MRPSVRNFLITLVSSILIFGAIAFFVVRLATSNQAGGASGEGGEGAEATTFDPANPYPDALNIEGNSFTVCLIGTDYNPSSFLTDQEYWNNEYLRSVGMQPEGEKALWVPNPSSVNADAIVLLRFDKEHAECVVSSIPTNTEVSKGGMGVALGSLYDSGGPEEICNRVFGLTSLKPDYYAVLNLEEYEKVMNNLGSVEFEVPFDMNYTDPSQDLRIDLKKGDKNLNSEKSEQLLRFSGNGETARSDRIADFLSAVLDQKFVSLKDGKLTNLFDAVAADLTTDFGEQDLIEHSSLILAVPDMDITVISYPGQTETYDGVEYFAPNSEEAYKLFAKYKVNYYPEESEK